MSAFGKPWTITGAVWRSRSRKLAQDRANANAAPAIVVAGCAGSARSFRGWAVLLDRPDDQRALYAGQDTTTVTVDLRPTAEPERSTTSHGLTYRSRPLGLARRSVARISYPHAPSSGYRNWSGAGDITVKRYVELTVGIRPDGAPLAAEDLLLLRCAGVRDLFGDARDRIDRLTGWTVVADDRVAVEAYERDQARTTPADAGSGSHLSAEGDAWCRDAALWLLRDGAQEPAELSTDVSAEDIAAFAEYCRANRAPEQHFANSEAAGLTAAGIGGGR